MAEVKWIKIVTDIFDDEKILLIESMPESDGIIVIWFKLLCLAGKQNNNGVFLINERIPYTTKMLATIFRRKEATVELALKVFEDFGMIKIINNTITIPNWGKHQNFSKIEKNKEYMQDYMKEYRAKQKLLAEQNSDSDSKVNSKVNSKVVVNALDKNREDKNREDKNSIEESKMSLTSDEMSLETDNLSSDDSLAIASPTPTESKKEVFNNFLNIYNQECTNLPKCLKITEKRKVAINKCLKEKINEEVFKQICIKANQSDFLIGENDRNWKADFDFITRSDKAMQILEGKYESKTKKQTSNNIFYEIGKEEGIFSD